MGKHWMPSLAAQLAIAILAGVWMFHVRSCLHIQLIAHDFQNWGRQTSGLGLPWTPRPGWLLLRSVSFWHGAVGSCPKVQGHGLAQLSSPWHSGSTSINCLLFQSRTHCLHSTQVPGALAGKLRSTWRPTWPTATIFGRLSHWSCCFYQHIAGHWLWWFGWFGKRGDGQLLVCSRDVQFEDDKFHWDSKKIHELASGFLKLRCWKLCQNGDGHDAGGLMLGACEFHPGEHQRYPHVRSLCSVQIHHWSGPPWGARYICLVSVWCGPVGCISLGEVWSQMMVRISLNIDLCC